MFEHGVSLTPLDKRDYSYHRTFGSIPIVTFPASLDLDNGFYMPNQNAYDAFFGFPAMPYGCTEFTCNELCADEDKTPYNPWYTEQKVHANAKGGIDMRTPLASVCNDGVLERGIPVDNPNADIQAARAKRLAYFRVGQNPDYFDGVRTALMNNRRSVSVGTPWFPEWSAAGWGLYLNRTPDGVVSYSAGAEKTGIMPMPDITKLAGIPWHCYKISGWITRDGVPYLRGKVWAGIGFGDAGWAYLSREVFNAAMTIWGTSAFTLAKPVNAQIATVGETYLFRKNLTYGANDVEVAELQKALISLGYTIQHAVTTYYGGETRAALARFQGDYAIVDDGTHFGPLTRYKMNQVLNPAQTLLGEIQLILQTFLGI